MLNLGICKVTRRPKPRRPCHVALRLLPNLGHHVTFILSLNIGHMAFRLSLELGQMAIMLNFDLGDNVWHLG